MKMWEWLLFFIVGIAGMMILITIASNLLRGEYLEKEIKGDRQFVVSSIVNLVYKCYEKNAGRRGSVICYQFSMNSRGEITSSDIEKQIDSSRVDKVIAEDLGDSGEIVIRYENQIIYIEKVEHERIST